MEPGHVTEYPLNHARILYGNAITAATATGARAKFPASAALTETTYERWSPATSGDSITLTFPTQNINAIALAAHSGLNPLIEVWQSGAYIPINVYPLDGGPSLVSDFATDTHQLLNVSPDNQAILLLLKPRRIDTIRITVTYSGTAPTLGVVRAGNVLEMARPFYQGHNPAILAADNTLRPNVSESGEWLGASLIRQGRSVKMDWQNLASSWIREKWTPFSKTIKTSPFIIAWNPKKFSTDVFYCSSSDTPQPTHSGPRDLMSVSLSARGYSDGTEPEVLNLANSTFDNLFTFTRASVATITDIDGMLREVGADVPRLVEYDGAGGALGLLIEEQRTNLLLWSENFTDGLIWAGSNVTLQGNVAKNIDGSMTADLLSTDTTTNQHRIRQNISCTSGVKYCGSVYAKAGTERFISLVFPAINDVFLVGVNTTFDLVTGEYSIGPDAVSAGAVYVGGGFYLCYVTVQAQATATSAFDIRITDSLVNRVGATNGTGAENVILGAAQVEEGSFPTSYIPTAGTQVTRAADRCSLTLGDEYNASEGTIYCELTYPVGAGSHYTHGRSGGLICGITPPSGAGFTNQFVVYRYLGDLWLSFRDAGRSGFDRATEDSGLPINEGVSTKIAVSWKAGVGFTFSVAGATSVSAFSDLPAFASDYLSLTTAYDGSEFSGIKKDFRIFPTALSEAELITLTGG